MAFTVGVVGAGQFSGQFAALFQHHPGVSAVHVTDVISDRADDLVQASGLAGTFASFEDMIAWASTDETLHAGEFFGSGCVGGCSGMELDRWVKAGDVVELVVPGIGTLRNRYATPD